MGYQLDKVIRDNVPFMITITLGFHMYTSELVQLSEQVGRELHSRPKKNSLSTAKLSITQKHVLIQHSIQRQR